ncbi:MAG: TRAP transporter fused permease subunit [Hyphomicrobiaceae bacterium]
MSAKHREGAGGRADGDGPWRWMLLALAVLSVGYHIYLVIEGLIPNLVSRPLHLAAALPFVFLFPAGPTRSRRRLVADAAACALGLALVAWVVVNRDALDEQYGRLAGPHQLAIAIGLIAIVLEMARRQVKLALPVVAVVALAYGAFGQHLPGELGHPGVPLESLLGTLTIAEGGIWGALTGVSAEVVAVFVILGALVGAGEGGRGFMSLAVLIAGRLRAGAAKVSVLSSALFGSISGSASANVASTGAVTLPAMKRLGYPPALAGAVEAVASSGGQIMPPIMGAGAFVMVELLRTSYGAVMAAALMPAILFFWAVWAGVDLYGRRYGLRAMTREEIPRLAEVARLIGFFVVPFGTLIVLLFARGATPQYAGGAASLIAALLLLTDERFRLSLSRWASRLEAAVVDAARQIATIASIIICAGLVIGVLNLTGLGVKITSVILALAGGNLWAALLLTALACLILGMEVPTTAAYVICISVAGPALTGLGLDPLAAHMFVFWYALLSTITPPVCGTVFIAAGMVGANWLAVAGHAMVLGIGLYIVPLAFIANSSLIALADRPFLAVLACLKIGAGLWLIGRALVGDTVVPMRLALGAGGLLVIFAFGV